VGLAYEAMRRGGTAPAVLNAANEVAVEAFLANRLRFIDIPQLIEDVLSKISADDATTLEGILAADQLARAAARDAVATRFHCV
jgi:1-deoxy-D-xylulose-5-phosphate reductoisomerase